ncbi:hypothetical protein KI387_004700 [Taxus chinensis]|uniref:AB hydrolase-1 domain-containing protein n=1 Tax=Taxus chinensis TaxID=29808 RepID=A0AA38GJQ9_TAXCH|nr:hypothetical protein KI387_004700 [Taxus chinensis]
MSPAKFRFLVTIVLLAGNIYCEAGSNHGILDAFNARVLGSGNKTLVLSHGFGSDQTVWQKVLPYFLKKGFKVITFDLAFAGAADPSRFDFNRYGSFDGYVHDVLLILDELKVDECVFVGHSMSAMIGSIAAIQRPNLFEHLILLGGSPRYLNAPGYEGGFEQTAIDQLFRSLKSNYTAWATGFASMAVGSQFHDAVHKFRKTLLAMRPDIAYFVGKQVFESDERSILREVKVPCLVIQSKKDIIAPLFVAEYLKTHLGRKGKTQVEILQTQGHFPQLSIPSLVIRAFQRIILTEN